MTLTMKNTVIPLIGVSCLLLGACTNSFGKVRQAVADAPDWYEQRREEIRGEGYPEVIDIPVISADNMPGQTLHLSAERAAELRAAFETSDRAGVPANTLAEITALRESIRQGFAGLPADPGFLTEEEISAIRASFDVPRVTQGLRAASR